MACWWCRRTLGGRVTSYAVDASRTQAVPLADGSWVALEAPYYAYVESYPRAPAPGTEAQKTPSPRRSLTT
jgi:hypothetical protein